MDVGMEDLDSTESCNIVGLFLLDQLTNRIKELEAGIYRDDALGEHGLKVTSKANLNVVEFLDVSLKK